jgi:hypothetical protein
MDWIANVIVALAILLMVGATWILSAIVVGALARTLHRRSKAPWRNFDRDAERLHRLTHPEDSDPRGRG